ncbi:MAG: hypothetical protein AAF891_06220 [Pseudomonadota bacterium]
MDKRVFLPIACALALVGAPLSAAEHEVLMVEGGFFPDITYLNAGDSVKFTNLSGASESVSAGDASWTTAEILNGGSHSFVVTEDTFLQFVLDDEAEVAKTAMFSFAAAPTQ